MPNVYPVLRSASVPRHQTDLKKQWPRKQSDSSQTLITIRRRTRKPVSCKGPWVRIPPSPLLSDKDLRRSGVSPFFVPDSSIQQQGLPHQASLLELKNELMRRSPEAKLANGHPGTVST